MASRRGAMEPRAGFSFPGEKHSSQTLNFKGAWGSIALQNESKEEN